MSLLPQQILPQTDPIGTVLPEGKVQMDVNWWLYFYNIGKEVLGVNGSTPTAIQPLLFDTFPDPLTAQGIGQQLYPITKAEITASVTPYNYAYPLGNVLRYGPNTVPGGTDMTAAFNNALSCNTEVYAPGGTYLIASQIVAQSNTKLFGDGSGTVLNFSSTTNQDFIVANGISNFTVSDMKLVATGVTTANNNYQAVVAFRASTNCRAQRLEITGFYLDGINVTASSKCIVEDNYIHDSAGALGGNADIHVNSSLTTSSTDNIISNNRCYGLNNDFGIAVFQTTLTGPPILRTTVIGNHVDAHNAYGILLYDATTGTQMDCYHQVIGNLVENITGSSASHYGCGIYDAAMGACTFTGNTVRNCCTATSSANLAPGGIGINISATQSGCTITGNSIYDMAQGNANSVNIAGIFLAATGLGCTVSGNTISQQATSTALQCGIYLESSVSQGGNNVQITGNTINIANTISGTRGIFIDSNSANITALGVDNNNVIGCSTAAIEIGSTDAVTNVSCSGNKVSGVASGCIGLLVNNLAQATITGNSINANNGTVLSLTACTQTRITGNSFNTSGSTNLSMSGTCTGSALDESNFVSGVPGSIGNSTTGLVVSFYAAASPAAGTFQIGDTAVNTAPTSTGTDRWRCTTAGTSGVWTALTLP